MTINELRKRKQELVRQKYELECRSPNERDSLALAIVSEELWDVLEQIKALTPSAKAGKAKRGAAPGYGFVLDRQQFLNWQAKELSLDDVISKGHAQLREETLLALDRLPPRQREVLELEMTMPGCSPMERAQSLGIARSTLYNRTYIAKKNLREESEKALEITHLLDGKRTLDLSDASVMKAVLLAITPSQAAYFYLYYSEGMASTKISKLTGVHRSTVVIGITRALRRIDILLNRQDVILEYPEALDKLGYNAYRELRDLPELVQANSFTPKPYNRWSRQDPTPPRRTPYKCTIHVQVFKRRLPPDAPPGKLRAALMECGEEIIPALTDVFAFCQYRLERNIELPSADRREGNDD